MNVGYVGGSPLAAAAARRLLSAHRVFVLEGAWSRDLVRAGAVASQGLTQLAQSCDVIILHANSAAEVRDKLFAADGMSQALSAGKIVIDQTPGDPDQARAIAAELQKVGVTLVDAPIHCELAEALPQEAAIMCGGPADTIASVRPILEAICPKVIHFGDVGNGHAARLVVGAVAACNRLITYECTAMGLKNGLTLADMALVLSKSSGSNSALERVLPSLEAGGRTADVTLGAVLDELRMASQLAMRLGAPMLVANLVYGLLRAEANDLEGPAGLDDTIRLFDRAAGTAYAAAKASKPSNARQTLA